MKTRLALIVAAGLFLPLLVAGCGGSDDTNSGTRPSAADISAAFTKTLPAGTPSAAAECLGKKLEASDLPNGVLRSLVAGEEKQQIDKDNEAKYTKIVTDITTACITELTQSGAGSN